MVDPTTNIILSTERFKGAPKTDQFINVPFSQTNKELVEFDRSVDLNLATVFDEERQLSTIFRPVTKFTILFENAYTGSTKYAPYRDNLYYTNAVNNAVAYYYQGIPSVPPNAIDQTVLWDGFPQYPEFDFIRTDYGVSGYTFGNGRHLDFFKVSASTYNWTHYLSYAYTNDYNKQLYSIEPQTTISWSWVVSDGIPFYIKSGTDNLVRDIQFKCPLPHGLSVGEFVELSINYNSNSFFQITSLGDPSSGSDVYIFNIRNVGYTGTTFDTNTQGTFKRILNLANSADTISKYYIRRHKIITNYDCSVLTNAGFEQNVYFDKKKCEIKVLTPNQKQRTSVKEGSKSYNLSFNCDVDLNELQDNQNRPVSNLYFTTIWRGYFGWTQKLKQGWYFNTYLDGLQPQIWWDQNNINSNTLINQNQYTSLAGQGPFFYNDVLVTGDTIDGDFCEWNNFEQLERVISEYQHKMTYNNNWFSLSEPPQSITNQFGYFYSPHSEIQIRSFSDYIEEGSSQNVIGIPHYSYYSTTNALFRWRDLYPYGFIDTDSIGVDFPFLNNTHYPYKNTIFRITPENYNIPSDYSTIGQVPANITTIADPTADECE